MRDVEGRNRVPRGSQGVVVERLANGARPAAAGRLRVCLFGRLRVERGDRAVPVQGRAGELLSYLLVFRDRAHRREELADRLWGERSAGDPRKTLRQALWHLQSNIDPDHALLDPGGQCVQLRREADLWLDVDELEQSWLAIEGEGEKPDVWERARRALDLYRGDLLEGNAWDWCVFERARLRELYLAMADRTLHHCLAENELPLAVRLAYEILRHDPAREQTHRHLIRLYGLAGDRAAAMRQYERCANALRDELGLEPSQRTRELVESIRQDRLADLATPSEGSVAEDAQAVATVLRRLRELLHRLSDERDEVHVEIQAIERALTERD
jgi:DNA-binding SARP family transcriptional activator